jgi:hypothetical protein
VEVPSFPQVDDGGTAPGERTDPTKPPPEFRDGLRSPAVQYMSVRRDFAEIAKESAAFRDDPAAAPRE